MDKFVSSLIVGGNTAGLVCGIAYSEVFGNIYLILGAISFIIGIVAGIWKLVLLIKKSLKDGKITEEEMTEIVNQAENIKHDIDEQIKK